jgi:alpha-L-fucosidase 2
LSIIDYLLKNLIVKCNSISSKSCGPSSSLSLWYEKPALEWVESLPIGNGSLGGMIFGGYPRETIQLNSDTLWAGCPHDYSNEDALKYLPEIRELISDNKWIDAQTILREHFFGKPVGQAPYQTVGNLFIDFFEESPSISIDQYQRELNLEKSLTRTSYSNNCGINYQRNCFSSYPDKCIIYNVQSSVNNSFIKKGQEKKTFEIILVIQFLK